MNVPRDMKVVETETAVTIQWRWRPFWGDPTTRWQLGCGLIWLFGTLGMLIFFSAVFGNWTILYILLGLTALALYFLVARFVNHTTIHIDPEILQVRHAPLPYPGNRRIKLNELNSKPFKVHKRTVHHPRRGLGSDFWVQATRRGGETVHLLKAIPDREDAQFIVTTLNHFRESL